MLGRHKEHKAAREYREDMARWQEQRDGYAGLLDLAQNFSGAPSAEIELKAGEGLFYQVSGAGLIEERRGAGHYQAGWSGVSVPVGSIGGRSVRYRVGANRGHYVQGAPTLATVDVGAVFVTNQRVVFAGAKQTRECDYASLISFQHDDADGSTTLSVSNRQQPTTVHYGPKLSASFDFRLDLALAHYRGTVPALIDQLRQELAEIDAHRPFAPVNRHKGS